MVTAMLTFASKSNSDGGHPGLAVVRARPWVEARFLMRVVSLGIFKRVLSEKHSGSRGWMKDCLSVQVSDMVVDGGQRRAWQRAHHASCTGNVRDRRLSTDEEPVYEPRVWRPNHTIWLSIFSQFIK